MKRTPSAQEARPAQCGCCGAASRPVGQRLKVHGHGQRERQVRGPLEPGSQPVQVVITVRRYLCLCCKATMTVGPRGLLPRRLFSAAAMGLALYLWGARKQPVAAVYEQVNPWQRAGEAALKGWRQLRRWIQEVVQGRLFGGLLPGPLAPSRRAVAERAAVVLATRCPAPLWTQPMAQQVFMGASLAV